MRNDPSFNRCVIEAKRRHVDEEFQTLDSTLNLFCDIVRPIVPRAIWPKIHAELALAVTNLKHDLKVGGSRRTAAPSGHLAELSLAPIRFEEVALSHRDRRSSALDL